MLTNRYMASLKNVSAIMSKIKDGTAPEKFSQAHLKGLGFKSSNDMGIIAVLKDLKFLTPDGAPTQRYHDYRDRSKSKRVMAEALKEAYEDLFHIHEKPTKSDLAAIEGKFKSVHNATDRIAKEQAKTFFALLDLADLNALSNDSVTEPETENDNDNGNTQPDVPPSTPQPHHPIGFSGLRYNIEVHLPATKDIEVYNAIFKSLKEHLIDD